MVPLKRARIKFERSHGGGENMKVAAESYVVGNPRKMPKIALSGQ